MPAYALFLRAVNVGGTGKLPMADLRQMLSDIGCTHITTYIASGNAVCHFDGSGKALRSKLETALETYAGKPVGGFVLTQPELDALLTAQPFEGAGNQIMCLLLDHTPTTLTPKNQTDEALKIGPDCIFIHYPNGMSRSRLTLPEHTLGTARNLNTMVKVQTLLAKI
ncbi:DUF1697 domain-containing protein [Tropicibacter sp. R15_0]|uniref:DUF1697 domain-containing protein n=1 Tax=Tropicibacter sp. R15_0 TaxID=2821101 RepID=UPI001AD95C7A|nr:DUF1697 domain-containing protein [Tropicibacter sp. R15_0]MBO9466061.1 DUF1697 domain-containing protein [Tropicibacter sp. R15_0]